MSNFTGVTFAQQKVLPSDDAIIRRNILSDGVLYGCQLSYSGSTLTMGAGQLLICGRQIRHPSAQNWAVADATSGFARLVLTVDLTRTASKEVFEQVVDYIEYATAQDGFPELNQSDVNTTGSVYQAVACVVSLGTGGITGIVEQLGPCEVAGGGGLNFKLVGGLTQPTDPAENTIWVPTDIEITGYDFNVTEPAEPVEGMVWVLVGTSSTAAFNAIKKNILMVYPMSAKQYVSGSWVDKTAKIYQSAKWVDLWLVIVKSGIVRIPLTLKKGTGTFSVSGNKVTVANGDKQGGYFWEVDVTNFNTLHINCSGTWSNQYNRPFVGVFDASLADVAVIDYGYNKTSFSHNKSIPISSLSGKYLIGVKVASGAGGGSGTITYTDVYLK